MGAEPGQQLADRVAVADDHTVDAAHLARLGLDPEPTSDTDQGQRRLRAGAGDLERGRATGLGEGAVRQEGAAPGRDNAVNTPRGPVRVPTVIVAANYAKVPLRRPRFGARGIWERDGGVCQYTGRKLAPKEGNIDHVVPRSRGGKTSWDNCVLAHREVNSRKANRLPHEAGLRLRKQPVAPRVVPASVLIRNHHGVRDWEHFLG